MGVEIVTTLWAQQNPVIVKIIEPPSDPLGLADTLVTALGLTGALVLLAIVAGAIVAGAMFLLRSRNPLR